MNKKVLHIISGDLDGGAARGAYWLHLALLDLNVDSKILTNSTKKYKDKRIYSLIDKPYLKVLFYFKFKLNSILLNFYKKRSSSFFSPSLIGFDITKHKLYIWADIVHLHWVNGGYLSINTIAKIKKPVVWTLRDMWPFTGGCHYSLNCKNYIEGCGNCPALGSSVEYDLSKYIYKKKRKLFKKNINLVGISNWISKKSKESKLFSDHNTQTIFNCINTLDFLPVNKEIARNVLNIESNKKIILTAAQDVSHNYKGFNKYLEAIKNFDKEDVYLIFFGNLDSSLMDNLGFQYTSFGFVKDLISLRLLYSAADVFIASSIMEAFGKTLIEAMSCKTPVVCFDIGGPKDIVEHKQNGYKAQSGDSNDLFKGVKWVLNNNNNNCLGISARKRVIDKFDSKIAAKDYKSLYINITSQNEN